MVSPIGKGLLIRIWQYFSKKLELSPKDITKKNVMKKLEERRLKISEKQFNREFGSKLINKKGKLKGLANKGLTTQIKELNFVKRKDKYYVRTEWTKEDMDFLLRNKDKKNNWIAMEIGKSGGSISSKKSYLKRKGLL